MIKSSLIERLSAFYPDEELEKWFDQLTLEISEHDHSFRIVFPHVFFARWFFATHKAAFEEYIVTITGTQAVFQYFLRNGRVYDESQTSKKTETGVEVTPPLPGNKKQNKEPYAPLKKENGRTIDKRCTFERFLINKKNEFPHAAAKTAVKTPEHPVYTPFIIYGQSGSGKTHLLNAMGNYVSKHCDLSFFYGSAEEVLSLSSAQKKSYTIFFLDDVQQIVNSEELQKQFIVFFDMVVSRGSLLALCIDGHPRSYDGFLHKMRSRMTSGLVVELKKPDLDIRYRYILRSLNELDAITEKLTDKNSGDEPIPPLLTKEEALTIAQRYQDFRSLNGALVKIKAFNALVETKSHDLGVILGQSADSKPLTAEIIIHHTSKLYNVTIEDITGKSRKREASKARQAAVYLCRELLGLPLVHIGNYFGGRDHSSILYILKKVQELKQNNKDTNNKLDALKKMCLSV